MQITEIENTGKVRLTGMDHKCDDFEGMDQVPDPLHKSFFYMFIAPPGGGKTTLALNLIKKRRRFYNQLFDQVHIFSGSLRTINEKLGLGEDRLHEGLELPELEKVVDNIDDEERALLVFDDVVASIERNMKPFLRIAYNRRHIGKGVSIMLLSQKLLKVPHELRCACNGVFLFRTSNMREINSMWEEYFPMPKDQFLQLLKYCWRGKHDFMFVKLDAVECKKYHRNFNQLLLNN